MDLTYATIPVFGGSIEDCTEKLSWPTLLVMKQTPPIILSFPLILIWDPVYCSSLMLLNLLLKSESNPLLSVKILLQLPLFGKCSFDGASSREGVGAGVVFVSPVKKPYLCPTS
jgi:hypothetical protein